MPAAAGEVSDKGAINQRLGLQNRERLVEALFAEPPSPAIIHPLPEPDP